MSVDWSKVLEWVKPGPVIYLSAWLVSLGALALPAEIMAWLGLTEWVTTHRNWIGGVFLVSSGLSVVEGVQWTLTNAESPVNAAWRRWRLGERLENLSGPEKEALRRYLKENTTTQHFPISGGVANGLEAKGILYRASTVGSGMFSFPYNLQPWAWDALRARPELVGCDGDDVDTPGS